MANLSSGELSRAILALLFRPDYIHYIFFVGFPMYLHCIYLLRFFKRFANFYFSTHRSHLKLLHLFGSFPCLFPLYTFVTLLERCIWFFSESLAYICFIYLGGFPMHLHCIRLLRFSEDSWYFFFNIQILYTSFCYILWDVFPTYFHCIRLLHFLRAVSNSFLASARLHPLHILGWFPYVFALYTFVMLFRGFLIFFFQQTDLVYICYILQDVFPINFHCIRSLHFLRAVSNSFLDSARLHPLHILGWFPYIFPLYTFVTLFESCI